MRGAAALVLLAGLLGAAGVALAARAAHGGANANLALAAQFLLIHAAALPGLAAAAQWSGRGSGFLAAAWTLAAGVCLFSGDIASRELAGAKLFDMAAPTGGSLMILGWLVLALWSIWVLAKGARLG